MANTRKEPSRPNPGKGSASGDRRGRTRAGHEPDLSRESGVSRRRIVEGIAVFLVAVVAYANTLSADFTLDDIPIIKENELIRSLANVGRIFKTNYWGERTDLGDKSLYRPLTITSYALNYAVHELSPRGYHIVNVLLHAVACLLLYALVILVLEDAKSALVAGVLFAVHPIHTEVVAGIVGRAEIMALVGNLLCCLAFVFATRETGPAKAGRAWVWVAVSIVSYSFAVFSKEIGLVGPVFIVLWEMILPHRRRLFRADSRAFVAFLGYAIIAVVFWVGMRDSVVKTNSMNVAFLGTTKAEQIWTALRVCMEYVGLLLAPIRLSADYWKPEVPFARSPTEPAVLAAISLLVLLVVAVAGSWRRRPQIAWGICAFLVLLFPVSNLPFLIGVLKAERILYTPSLGFIVALAALATAPFSWSGLRRSAQVVVWALAATFLFRTWVRNDDWRDNCTLAEVTLKSSPSSAIFNSIMASCYRKENQNGPAREHLLRSIESQPGNAMALFNLGNIDREEGRFDAAIGYYRRALEFHPRYVSVLNNLGRALAESGRLREAVEVLKQSKEARSDNPAAYVNLLSIYIQLKDLEAAVPLAKEAQQRFPDIPVVHLNAGSVYLLAGRKEESQAAYRRAKELDPDIESKGDVESSMD